jgi:hypothetical protein
VEDILLEEGEEVHLLEVVQVLVVLVVVVMGAAVLVELQEL